MKDTISKIRTCCDFKNEVAPVQEELICKIFYYRVLDPKVIEQ